MATGPTTAMTEREREKAETAIQKILVDLEEKTAQRIDSVDVDTRNFANCKIEIFFR